MNREVERLLESHRGEISQLCKKFAVQRLRIFGSALRPDWDPAQSDLDFVAEYGPERMKLDPLDSLVGLQMALAELFKRSVDVVDWGAAKNPYFREVVESQAQELYAS